MTLPSRPLARATAALVALALHVLVLVLMVQLRPWSAQTAPVPLRREAIVVVPLQPPQPSPRHEPAIVAAAPMPRRVDAAPPEVRQIEPAPPPPADRPPATTAAPAAPTAEEWAMAGQYTLKNSKRYRYAWGVQVRSMMGAVVEGPDQGLVRFRIEIAPDGRVARVDTLWTTSVVAEQRARAAIASLPPLPLTPTGQPLVFERTIAFTPFATDDPPLYRDDCLPDPPAFRNPFAWDGKSPQMRAAPPPPPPKPDPRELEECLKQLPRDSIEAEAAHDRRLMEQWGWSRRTP